MSEAQPEIAAKPDDVRPRKKLHRKRKHGPSNLFSVSLVQPTHSHRSPTHRIGPVSLFISHMIQFWCPPSRNNNDNSIATTTTQEIEKKRIYCDAPVDGIE